MEFRAHMKLILTAGENSVTPAISHRYNGGHLIFDYHKYLVLLLYCRVA